MKVRYLGETESLCLTHGKIYEVIDFDKKLPKDGGNYRIVDESGEDYLYNPENFEIVEE